MSRVAFLFLSVILLLVPIAAALATSSGSSLEYIASFQDQASGGVKEEYVDEPQPLESDWAIMAFSASLYNPATVGQPKSLLDFTLNDACSLASLTDTERRILALESAGVDTHMLPGCNLPQKIIDQTQGSGQIGDGLVSTVFGALALAASNDNIPATTVAYIESHQNENGGWDSGYGTESNFTSQTIMALSASRQAIDPSILTKAKEYLKNLQTETGGIKYDGGQWSTESDAFSDSYALQAIYSLGEDPGDLYWLNGGHSIIDDLRSLYNADGSFKYNRTYGNMNPVWTSAIASISLSERFLPIHASSLQPWDKPTDSSPSPKPSASSVSSTPTSISSATIAPSIVATATPIAEETQTFSAKSKVLTQAQSPVVFPTSTSQPFLAQMQADPSPISQGTVLGESTGLVRRQWRWVVVIAIFSLCTGWLIAFIERRYVKKNQK